MQNQLLPPENSAEITPHVTPFAMPAITETAETLPDIQAVTDMLTSAQHTIRRRKRRYLAAFAVCQVAGLTPLALLLLSRHWQHSFIASHSPWLMLPPLALAWLALMLMLFLPVKLDAEALWKLGGVKTIPTLIDAYGLNSSLKHRKTVLHALTLLLPQLQATDAHLLTSAHRRWFNMILTNQIWLSGIEDDFRLALLKAYEQIGDAKAIPAVERLANRRPRNEGQCRLQMAAQDCLPLLRARVDGADTTQTLLRPSMPETNTPDTLLRAAAFTTNASPDELLRATTPANTPPTS